MAGAYCLVYALAGAVIGTAAKVLYPKLGSPDDAFATIVKDELPVGVRGLVPILGGLLWERGTVQGALAAVVGGGLAVVGLMAGYDILANEPVYYDLLSSLVAYVAVSPATRPTDAAVPANWRERLAGRGVPELVSEPVPAHQ